MAWNDVQVLLTLLETRSLKGAAKRLDVDSSTVGRRLDALEQALGVQLFERSRAGVLPTASAQALAPSARRFADAAASFAHATTALEDRPTGEVRIAAPAPIASNHLVPLLPGLRARFPELSFDIDPGLSVTNLDKHAADLALRGNGLESGLPGGENLLARKLWSGPCIPVASEAYAAELGTLDDLGDARWVTYGPRHADLRWAKMVLDHVPPAQIVMRSDDTQTLLSAVAHGVGASWMNRLMCVSGIVELPLAPKLDYVEGTDEQMWIIAHRSLRHVPRVDAVWNYLVEHLYAPDG